MAILLFVSQLSKFVTVIMRAMLTYDRTINSV